MKVQLAPELNRRGHHQTLLTKWLPNTIEQTSSVALALRLSSRCQRELSCFIWNLGVTSTQVSSESRSYLTITIFSTLANLNCFQKKNNFKKEYNIYNH